MQSSYLPYNSNFLGSIRELKRVLFIVAMESERDALLEGKKVEKRTLGRVFKHSFDILRDERLEVMIAQTGVGLVHTGILVSKILENRKVDAIIQLGVGGALESSLHPGDIVVSNKIIQHDSIASLDGESRLMAPGELTLSLPSDQQIDPVMRTDRVLRDWIYEVLHSKKKNRVALGSILSGSEFVANSNRKKEIKKTDSEALMVDMEAAAIAQLARKANIAFVSAKTVADRAEPEQSISADYQTFLSAANRHARTVLDSLLIALRDF